MNCIYIIATELRYCRIAMIWEKGFSPFWSSWINMFVHNSLILTHGLSSGL